MFRCVRLVGLFIISFLLNGCSGALFYAALPVAAATTVRDVSVRDSARVIFVEDVRVTFSPSNASSCLTEYGLPNTEQFACSVVSFNPPIPRTIEQRIGLAKRAIDATPNLGWIINDPSQIARITRQLRPERIAQNSLWLAYEIR